MEIKLEDWFDNYDTIIKDNKDKKITLFHGSFDEIKEVKHKRNRVQGLYFTPSFVEANDYVVAQSENQEGEYGYIYKVKIPIKDMQIVNNIDNGTHYEKPIYSPEERYFRIDKMESYQLEKVDDNWITDNWDNPNVILTEMKKRGGTIGGEKHSSLGTAKETGLTTKVAGHDMIAKCSDCADKFSYQNSKSNILWECPYCLSRKHIS